MTFDLSESELERIAHPEFELAGCVHDWRNYVPGIVKVKWAQLSQETKEVTYLLADARASAEEWD